MEVPILVIVATHLIKLFIAPDTVHCWPLGVFSYTLMRHDKAVVIREDTMGVAVMDTSVNISQHSELVLGFAETTHPKTMKNWKDFGVIADYQIFAQKVLELALELDSKNKITK